MLLTKFMKKSADFDSDYCLETLFIGLAHYFLHI